MDHVSIFLRVQSAQRGPQAGTQGTPRGGLKPAAESPAGLLFVPLRGPAVTILQLLGKRPSASVFPSANWC